MVEKNCLAAKHLSSIKVVDTLEHCIEAIDNDLLDQSHWGLDEYWKKAAGSPPRRPSRSPATRLGAGTCGPKSHRWTRAHPR